MTDERRKQIAEFIDRHFRMGRGDFAFLAACDLQSALQAAEARVAHLEAQLDTFAVGLSSRRR